MSWDHTIFTHGDKHILYSLIIVSQVIVLVLKKTNHIPLQWGDVLFPKNIFSNYW